MQTSAPLHDLINLEPSIKRVNATLYPPHDPSIARQPPNDAADAIWEEYELTRFFPVTAAQIRAMGKDPRTVAKLEDDQWGLGDDAYVAILDVFHQLHCLNALRHIAYPEHYGNGSTTHPQIRYIHVNHCVDILMQALMCSGNVNLVTMHWVADHPYPFPDMSVNRQCINFDKLVEWRKENTIDMDKYRAIMDRDHQKVVEELPAADMFYEVYRPDMVNPNHVGGINPGEDFIL